MIPILTERLVLRNWEDRDRDLFHRINSDERVMEFFSFRRDRDRSDALMERLRAGIEERGWGFTAVEVAATGRCIGFVGLNPVVIEPVVPVGSTEIGWRLAPEFWGLGYATEAARAVIDYAFEEFAIDQLLAGARVLNPASRHVLEKCGFQWTGVELHRFLALGSSTPVDRFKLERGVWSSIKNWHNAARR